MIAAKHKKTRQRFDRPANGIFFHAGAHTITSYLTNDRKRRRPAFVIINNASADLINPHKSRYYTRLWRKKKYEIILYIITDGKKKKTVCSNKTLNGQTILARRTRPLSCQKLRINDDFIRGYRP